LGVEKREACSTTPRRKSTLLAAKKVLLLSTRIIRNGVRSRTFRWRKKKKGGLSIILEKGGKTRCPSFRRKGEVKRLKSKHRANIEKKRRIDLTTTTKRKECARHKSSKGKKGRKVTISAVLHREKKRMVVPRVQREEGKGRVFPRRQKSTSGISSMYKRRNPRARRKQPNVNNVSLEAQVHSNRKKKKRTSSSSPTRKKKKDAHRPRPARRRSQSAFVGGKKRIGPGERKRHPFARGKKASILPQKNTWRSPKGEKSLRSSAKGEGKKKETLRLVRRERKDRAYKKRFMNAS